MTPELRAFALAFGQPETPAPELSPNGYPQVLVSMEKLIAAIRDAERAAYKRLLTSEALTQVSRSIGNTMGERNHHARALKAIDAAIAYATDGREESKPALIDKETT